MPKRPADADELFAEMMRLVKSAGAVIGNPAYVEEMEQLAAGGAAR